MSTIRRAILLCLFQGVFFVTIAAQDPPGGIDSDIVAGLDSGRLFAQGLTPCDVLLTITDGAGEPGQASRRVQVRLQTDEPLTRLEFEVHDFPDLLTATLCNNFVPSFTCSVNDNGAASIIHASSSSTVGPGSDLFISELLYTVDPGAPTGLISLTPQSISALNDNQEACSVAGMPGSFAVSVCGDGVIDFPEECDDGNTESGDCCSSTCRLDADGVGCEDGLFCTVGEVCDGSGVCGGGGPRSCDDGISCTDDSCDEAADACNTVPVDATCDNGLVCDGTETCSPVDDCVPGTPLDCDDGISCTDDLCSEPGGCEQVPRDGLCDNGVFCDGAETCEVGTGCQAGVSVFCDDGDLCTDDTCDEGAGSCIFDVDSSNDPVCVCDDGVGVDCNDECVDAIPLGPLPALASGSTAGATVDSGIPTCEGVTVTANGVWFSVPGTGNDLVATTCSLQTPPGSATFDTKISVYCFGCVDAGPVCVAGNDDEDNGACGLDFTSTVEWSSEPGAEYLILVHGAGAATGFFELSVFEGGSGNTPVACTPPDPEGACCTTISQDPFVADCVVISEAECASTGGVYKGDETTCFPPTGQTASGESSPALPIPDNGGPTDAVNDSITIDAPGCLIGDLSVDVFIDHSWIGDLQINLTGPTGLTSNLWDQPCGTTDNLDVTFVDGGTTTLCFEMPIPGVGEVDPTFAGNGPAFSQYQDTPASGLWSLNVYDNIGSDTGIFEFWRVDVECGESICEPPLVVTLASFTAETSRWGTDLRWETISEVDNFGFRILRAREGEEPVVITSQIIPARGNELFGAAYKYRDDERQFPGTVTYYLEDIDVFGRTNRAGSPVTVEIVTPIGFRRP